MHASFELVFNPSKSPRRALGFVLSGAIALAPSPGFAAPPAAEPAGEEAPIDTEERAMTAFNDGQAAYDRGDYKDALDLFLEAQSLYPSPLFHYNIGRCYEALENYDQAITSYNAYLRSYKSSTGGEPTDKVNIENTISRLEKLLEAERAEDEAARNKDPVVIIKESDSGKKKKPGLGLVVTGGVLTGVGALVLAVGGAAFGIKAKKISNQIDDVYNNGNPENLTIEETRDLDAQGTAAERTQIIMMSIGGAVAVTGVALLVVGALKMKKAKSAKKSAKPGAQLVPVVGPGNAGFVLQGRF